MIIEWPCPVKKGGNTFEVELPEHFRVWRAEQPGADEGGKAKKDDGDGGDDDAAPKVKREKRKGENKHTLP